MRSARQQAKKIAKALDTLGAMRPGDTKLINNRWVMCTASGYLIGRHGVVFTLTMSAAELCRGAPPPTQAPHARLATESEREVARSYFRAVKKALGFFEANPGGTVRLSWPTDPVDLAGFRDEFRRVLERRLNAAGGLPDVEPRDTAIELWRDHQRLLAWPSLSACGLPLHTRLVRRRFPKEHAAMVERLRDLYGDHIDDQQASSW